MTFLGKAFTVMILVMSIVFISFTIMVFATHRNWEDRAIVAEESLRQEIEKNEKLVDDNNRVWEALTREQAAGKTHAAMLTSEAAMAQVELATLTAVNANLSQALERTEAAQEDTAEDYRRLTLEIKVVRDELARTRTDRDEQYDTALKAKDEADGLRVQYTTLTQGHDELSRETAYWLTVMDRHGIKPHDDIAGIPPRVKGEVLISEGNLIVVDLGSDDGLKVGHEIQVSRDGVYLGKAKIRKTSPSESVAEVLEGFRKGVVQKFDRVATIVR